MIESYTHYHDGILSTEESRVRQYQFGLKHETQNIKTPTSCASDVQPGVGNTPTVELDQKLIEAQNKDLSKRCLK